jgi:hypothetical protein
MLKRRTFFWWGTLLLVLIGLLWGYHLYTKPHASAEGETAAFSITADSLFTQYRKDEQGSDKKYLGKVLEVKGKLGDIQHNGHSEIWILSVQPGDSSRGGGINCQLFMGEDMPASHPKQGDTVIVKGRCTGFLMDVNLADCVPQ